LAPTNAPTKTPTEEPTTNEDANKESDKGTKIPTKVSTRLSTMCQARHRHSSTHSKLFYLGTAADYTILTKSGILHRAGSIHHRHIGVSPIAATTILALAGAGPGDKFSTAFAIYGKAFAASYGGPVAAALTVAVLMAGRVQRARWRANTDVARINWGGDVGGKT
jgi:hypothetical protein